MKLKRYFYLALTLFLFSLPMVGQTAKVSISGTVIDKGTSQAIEQATVRLLSIRDSSMIGGVATLSNGNFRLDNIPPGNYLLNVSYVGYETIYQALKITGSRSSIRLGKIALNDTGIALGEAVVVGKAPEVVVKNDTMEFNADSYKVTEGSVLEDLLKKMPGVEIDSNGKVTVNGKEIKKVLIDGKEFFSDDPKVASKNLPAKMIEKVQVLDRKSDMTQMTGFDDGDEETVINLTVKPGMKQGTFGNAFAGYGSKDRYEANAMVNRFINNDQFTIMGGVNNTNNMGFSDLASTMFSGMGGGGRRSFGRGGGNGVTTSGNGGLNFSKEFSSLLTLGGNGRYNHSNNYSTGTSHQQNILTGGTSSYYNESSFSRTINDNVGSNFRMEWKPDSMTQIIFRPNLSYSHSKNHEEGSFETLNNALEDVNKGSSVYHSLGEGHNVNGTLEFSRRLNSTGRVLSFSMTGGMSDSYNKGTNYSNTFYQKLDSTAIIDQQFRYDNNGYNYRGFLSWVEPIGHNNFLQATYSLSGNRQESLKKTYAVDDNGLYTTLDTTYSKSYRNNYITQRAGLSFMAKRDKYTFTIGMNFDPSYSKSVNFVGDTTLSSMSRHVVNYSPMAQLNYRFSKEKNLRINYEGETSQPTMTQLQPVLDVTDPLNVVTGNPNLDPTYTNNLSLRYFSFNREKQRAFMIMANGNYVINDIVSKSTYDSTSGRKISTYENVNGNYSANFRTMVNSPLKNIHFSVNNMLMASYSNSNGFINGEKNTNKNIVVSERPGIDFRSSVIDLGVNASFRYNGTKNSLQTTSTSNQNTFNYGIGGNTTLYLPWNMKVESDVDWSAKSGYTSGYNISQVLWNASASKSFLKGNAATIRFKIYDILHQRSNISRTVTANYTKDSEYNTLSSYFMFHFIYRFSIFKGGASFNDAFGGRRGPGGDGPHGGGPGGPPPGGPM